MPITPQTYIALLYSIGIGEGRRLIMADWRSMMCDIGLTNPRTLIATGNAVFESRESSIQEVELQLERAFERRFGRRVDTIVRTAASFRQLARGNPFPRESKQAGSQVMVRVMRQPIVKSFEATLQPYLTHGERVKIVRGDLWIHFKHKSNESRLVPVLGSKRMGIGTLRNWNTVCRLVEMLDQGLE